MNYKKSLAYFVVLSTLFSLVPVVTFNYSSAATCDPDALRPVSYGQRGEAVRNAQACLIEAGYDIPAGVTGYYGSQTRNAVREFYRDWYGAWNGNNLGPQGVRQLKSLLAQRTEDTSIEDTTEDTNQQTQQTQQSTQQNQQLMQLLTTLLPLLMGNVQLDATTTNELMQAISTGDFSKLITLLMTARTQQEQQQQQQQQVGEATVEVRLAATPAGGVVVKEGQSANVLGVRVISRNAPSEVKRLRFDLISSVVPTKLFRSFDLYLGEDRLASVPASDYNRVESARYEYNFTGLSARVPANGEIILVVRVNANPTIDSGDIGGDVKLQVKDGYLRALDTAGVQHTPSASNVERTFTLEKITPAGVALNIYRDQNTPYTNNFAADGNRDIRDLELLRFVLRADNDTIRVLSIKFLPVGNNLTITSLKLVDANNNVIESLASVDLGTTSEFKSINFDTPLVTVDRDTTRVLRILGDLKVDSGLAQTSSATITVQVVSAEGERASDQGNQQSTGSAQGDLMHIYRVVAANWRVLEATANARRGEDESTSTLAATFRVQITAQRGDVYIPNTGFVATTTGETQIGMGTPNVNPVSGVETSGNYFVVRANTTGVLEVNFAVTPSSWNSGFHQVKLVSMTWDNDTNSNNGVVTTTFPGTMETKTLTNSVHITR